MDFFYPNWINDFWRVMGLLFFEDKTHFEMPNQKKFDRQAIVLFAQEHGFSFFDTAQKVCRQHDNASDDFLEILEPTDVGTLLNQIPLCKHLVTTGGKASQQLMTQLNLTEPPSIGSYVSCQLEGRDIRWWRMPSTSRAYPLSLSKKTELYSKLFQE